MSALGQWWVTLGIVLTTACFGGGGGGAGGASTVKGRVDTEHGTPVSGAVIRAGSARTTTGIDGSFKLSGLPAGRVGVTVTADGYFAQSFGVELASSVVAYRDVVLMDTESASTTVPAAAGGTFSLRGATVTVPPSAFQTLGGAPYGGPVSLAVAGVQPDAPGFDRVMPGGDFRGRNAQGEDGALMSLGFAVLDVRDAAGNPLTTRTPLQITMPVPPGAAASLGADARLWKLDPATSRWVDRGPVTLAGNAVTVQATTDSAAWNCDAWSRTGVITGKAVDCTGKPASGVRVRLVTSKASLSAYTGSDGAFSVRVPAPYTYAVSAERDGRPATPPGNTVTVDVEGKLDAGQFAVPCSFEGPFSGQTTATDESGCRTAVSVGGSVVAWLSGDGTGAFTGGGLIFRGEIVWTVTSRPQGALCDSIGAAGETPICTISGANGALTCNGTVAGVDYQLSSGTVAGSSERFTGAVVAQGAGWDRPINLSLGLTRR